VQQFPSTWVVCPYQINTKFVLKEGAATRFQHLHLILRSYDYATHVEGTMRAKCV